MTRSCQEKCQHKSWIRGQHFPLLMSEGPVLTRTGGTASQCSAVPMHWPDRPDRPMRLTQTNRWTTVYTDDIYTDTFGRIARTGAFVHKLLIISMLGEKPTGFTALIVEDLLWLHTNSLIQAQAPVPIKSHADMAKWFHLAADANGWVNFVRNSTNSA